MYFDPLFENHLLFMAAHRGSVRIEDTDLHIEGPIPSLVSLVPGSPRSTIPDRCPAVRLAPWSGGEAWNGPLDGAGFHRAEALAYMELADSFRSLAPSAPVKSMPSACAVTLPLEITPLRRIVRH